MVCPGLVSAPQELEGTPGEVVRWLKDWTMGFTEKGFFAEADFEHLSKFLPESKNLNSAPFMEAAGNRCLYQSWNLELCAAQVCSQNHRMAQDGGDHRASPGSTSLLSWVIPEHTAQCPDSSGTSPVREIPPPLCEVCVRSEKKPQQQSRDLPSEYPALDWCSLASGPPRFACLGPQ